MDLGPTPFSRMTLRDLEWVNKIFIDTKHLAVCLRQLRFLFKMALNVVLWRQRH